MNGYSEQFYAYTSHGSETSAQIIASSLLAADSVGPIASVCDFGCAQGVWLAAWKAAGVAEIQGVDGPWVDIADLQISAKAFLSFNLTDPIDLGGRTFDLVQSLEVAEHLPASGAAAFIDNLVRHGTMALFSAAPPGQGGPSA
ncbi:MAG: hypothetical protein HN423_05250 [Alphaproteobacteria bacterium]|nr:hypothetical protein [Alphaproteobacteria bacterium]